MNNQYTYNQQPQGEQIPPFAPMPPQMGMPGTVYGAQRQRRPNAAAKAIFPQWLGRNALITYFLALAVVSLMYSAYSLPWYYMLSGAISVVVFFLLGSNLVDRTSPIKMRRQRTFEQRIFVIAFIPRVIWMFLIYSLFMKNYGDAFGFEAGDALYYQELGEFVSSLVQNGNFHFYDEIVKWNGVNDDIADMGYGIYVGFVYWLTGNSIITVRLLKCIWSSWTVLLIYRLAKRNFDNQTARIAAIFCALWPNFWYYCGVHLKETEMVFLGVLFVEQADQMLRSRQFTAWKVIPILLIAATIFTFRTPLGLVALLSLIFSVVMSSSRVVSWGKRIIVGLLALILIAVTVGNTLEQQARGLIETARGNSQQENMEWRAKRANANVFSRYAGAAVFAPMIFSLPFPSMVKPFEGQDVQQLLNGGNYIKNILSGFILLALFLLLLSGKWRDHLLPLSFMLGYSVVLAFSNFAQSERFHQPIMPLEMMFVAYGLSVAVTKPKYKRWFMYWSALMIVACIAWNWFKLAGRGLA